MSAGRWDSSPDSRSMPTVDLQWWLSSTDVFCTGRGHIQNEFHTDLVTGWTLFKHRHMSRLHVPGRGTPGGVWSWWGRADWPQDGPHRGQPLPSDPGTRPEDSAALPAAESKGHVQSFQMNLIVKFQTYRKNTMKSWIHNDSPDRCEFLWRCQIIDGDW